MPSDAQLRILADRARGDAARDSGHFFNSEAYSASLRAVFELGKSEGIVSDKTAVREVVDEFFRHHKISVASTPKEQLINRIGRLQRTPANVVEIALTVGCPYCGRTPGNRCFRGGEFVAPHPSRVQLSLQPSLTSEVGEK